MTRNMSKLLEGRNIIITGGSTGIGRATALACARQGANIVLADINLVAAHETRELVLELGVSCTVCETDVIDSAAVENLISHAHNAFGAIHGAFNNAGIEGKFTNITRLSEEEFDRIIAVDLKGVWLSVKHEISYFLEQGIAGSIVNTASVAGLVGSRGGSAYCAAKHGVIGLSKSAALEFAKKSIRVNAVCPGIIETDMIDRMVLDTGVSKEEFIAQEPVGRIGQVNEVAEAVVWLLSEKSSFVTGTAMPVDGGYTAI